MKDEVSCVFLCRISRYLGRRASPCCLEPMGLRAKPGVLPAGSWVPLGCGWARGWAEARSQVAGPLVSAQTAALWPQGPRRAKVGRSAPNFGGSARESEVFRVGAQAWEGFWGCKVTDCRGRLASEPGKTALGLGEVRGGVGWGGADNPGPLWVLTACQPAPVTCHKVLLHPRSVCSEKQRCSPSLQET